MVGSKKAAKEKTDGQQKVKEVEKRSPGDVQQQLLTEPKKLRECGCCPVNMPPPDVGQKYFEAPDGHMILGEDSINQIRDRRNNAWINPAR